MSFNLSAEIMILLPEKQKNFENDERSFTLQKLNWQAANFNP